MEENQTTPELANVGEGTEPLVRGNTHSQTDTESDREVASLINDGDTNHQGNEGTPSPPLSESSNLSEVTFGEQTQAYLEEVRALWASYKEKAQNRVSNKPLTNRINALVEMIKTAPAKVKIFPEFTRIARGVRKAALDEVEMERDYEESLAREAEEKADQRAREEREERDRERKFELEKIAAEKAASVTAAAPAGPPTVVKVQTSPAPAAPQFKGDAIGFPAWYTSWQRYVKDAELSEESALEKLRLNLQNDGAALYAVVDAASHTDALGSLREKYIRPEETAWQYAKTLMEYAGKRLEESDKAGLLYFINFLRDSERTLAAHEASKYFGGHLQLLILGKILPESLRSLVKLTSDTPISQFWSNLISAIKIRGKELSHEQQIEARPPKGWGQGGQAPPGRDTQPPKAVKVNQMGVNSPPADPCETIQHVGVNTLHSYEKSQVKPSCRFNCGEKMKHFLDKCVVWLKKTRGQKIAEIRKNKLCFGCLRNTHKAVNCPRNMGNCQSCDKKHVQGVCPQQNVETNQIVVKGKQSGEQIFQLTEQIAVRNSQPIGALFDSGANTSALCDKYAKENKLKVLEENVQINLTLPLGKTYEKKVTRYEVPLVDQNGKIIAISAIGLSYPLAEVGPNDSRCVAQVFGLKPSQLQTHIQGVQLIIGADHVNLWPDLVKAHQNIRLFKSKFNPGYVVMGKYCPP